MKGKEKVKEVFLLYNFDFYHASFANTMLKRPIDQASNNEELFALVYLT